MASGTQCPLLSIKLPLNQGCVARSRHTRAVWHYVNDYRRAPDKFHRHNSDKSLIGQWASQCPRCADRKLHLLDDHRHGLAPEIQCRIGRAWVGGRHGPKKDCQPRCQQQVQISPY